MWNFHNLPFGTLNCSACCLCTNDPVVPIHSMECQMSKRTPATASKHARSRKIAAKAQRAAQTIVRSPKVRRSVAASSAETPPSLTTQNQRLPLQSRIQ